MSIGIVPAASACATIAAFRSEEHTSELQSQSNLVCRLLLEKKKKSKHYRPLSEHVQNPNCVHTFKAAPPFEQCKRHTPLSVLSHGVYDLLLHCACTRA